MPRLRLVSNVPLDWGSERSVVGSFRATPGCASTVSRARIRRPSEVRSETKFRDEITGDLNATCGFD